ncbi:AAA family ATPase [Nonomuraea sp. NPDC050153]|uniref:helix-turn-helix transcriptional regulator n=1 Tax=Nonomuraea sp. NPDC050153 TaxID=3364359 RepID=UPI00379233DA
MLIGRDHERAEIDRLLREVLDGAGRCLVLRGEAGIGKTALLDHAARSATGEFTVHRLTGVEPESAMPYAAIHLLVRGLPLVPLAAPRRAALEQALRGEPGDPLLVGLAVLDLLAAQGPVVVLADDVQWLDARSLAVVHFVARRVENAAMILAVADGAHLLEDLPELRLGRLDRKSAGELLRRARGPLPEQAAERLLDQADGNPLALTGKVTRLHDTFRRQVGALPPKTRMLLLVAVNRPRLEIVLRAGQELDLAPGDLSPAEEGRLVSVDGGVVVFRHPLLGHAVAAASTLAARIAVHHALARVLDGDLRAWHLAAAATGTDDTAARELEASALRARSRAARSEAYERSAELSGERADRTRRLIAAAEASIDAGRLDRAEQLADAAAPLAREPAVRARLASARAAIELQRGTPRAAHAMLIEGADLIAGEDPCGAAAMLIDALRNVWYTGDLRLSEQALGRLGELSLPEDDPRRLFAGRMREPGANLLRVLVDEARGGHLGERTGRLVLATFGFDGGGELAERSAQSFVADCRAEGIIGSLPLGLQLLATAQLYRGKHADAAAGAAEGLRVATDTGQRHRAAHHRALLAVLAALAGREEECRELAVAALSHADSHGIAPTAGWAIWALGLLELGLGRPEEALGRWESSPVRLYHGLPAVFTAADHVEAAVRAGRPELAKRPYAWLERLDLPWMAPVVLRCRALLAPAEEAGHHYEPAVRLHRHDHRPFERARTQLLYGEWLRRTRHLTDARAQLRSALETFEWLGALPWTRRARAELRAVGGPPAHLPEQERNPLGLLTPQEQQVVRLAATGASNKEIAGRLFLSPRTVGYHLYRAFPKLGVRSRRDLADVIAPQPSAAGSDERHARRRRPRTDPASAPSAS